MGGSGKAPLPMVFSDTGRNPHDQRSVATDALQFKGQCTWNIQIPPGTTCEDHAMSPRPRRVVERIIPNSGCDPTITILP